MEQLLLLPHFTDAVLHLDATVSLIRKPSDDHKRMYYYAEVVQIPFNNRVRPVFEMVSCDHDAASITNWLFSFRSFLLSHKNVERYPIKKNVVDFSFALINASVMAFNNVDLLSYLKILFDFLNKNTEFPLNFVFIHF